MKVINLKKFIAILVAASLLATCIFTVTAANENTVKKYDYYVSCGDSITAGFDIDLDHNRAYIDPENSSGLAKECYLGRIEGAYPDLISLATSKQGENNYHSLSMPGFRVKDLAYTLGYDVGDEEAYTKEIINALRGDPEAYSIGVKKAKQEELSSKYLTNADLITIGYGTNDLLLYSGLEIMNNFQSETFSVIELPGMLLETVVSNIADFIKCFNYCAEYIGENNKNDPDVYLIGMFNPFENVKVEGDDLGVLGTFYGAVVSLGNTMLKAWALKYGFTYINIKNLPDICEHLISGTVAAGEDIAGTVLNLRNTHTHPDYIGHEYIAECILEKMPDTLVETSLRTGNLELKINGRDVGMFGFSKSQNGWLIRDLDSGLYLTYKNGKIDLASEPSEWLYDGGFYVETAYSVLFIKRTEKTYIGYKNGSLSAGLHKQNIEFYKAA